MKQTKKHIQNRKGSPKLDQKLERIVNLISALIKLITTLIDIIQEL